MPRCAIDTFPASESWLSTAGGWLYAIQEEGTPLVKIGFSQLPRPEERLRLLWYELKIPLRLLAAVHITHWVRKVERQLHRNLYRQHIEWEWFYLSLNPAEFLAMAYHARTIVEKRRQDYIATLLGKNKPIPHYLMCRWGIDQTLVFSYDRNSSRMAYW